jgi:hypothetical protein
MLFARKLIASLLFTLCALVVFQACGSGNSTSNESQSQKSLDYSYSIDETINGQRCTYQSPHYANSDQYCAALQNTRLNTINGMICGEDFRHTLYQNNLDCPGEFEPSIPATPTPAPSPTPAV